QGLAPHVELLLDHDHHELAILAERIRGLRAASPPDEKALAELEEQLRDRVAAAFDARQESQRAEVAVLEQQLASVKQAIEQRDKERDELVEQRVDEWLSGAAVREPFEFRRRFELAVPRP